MKSHHLLSLEQYLYLTSQEKVNNPSEQRRRIEEKVQQSFKTFEIILRSKKIDQKYIDKVFPEHNTTWFLRNLTYYKSQNTPEVEENKFHTAENMIKLGLFYYRIRFRKYHFIQKRLDEFEELLTEYRYFISQQVKEIEESKKKNRKKINRKSNSKVKLI